MNKAIQVLRENQHFNKWFIEATAEAIEKASEKARAEERKKFNEELIKMQAELIKKQSEEHVKLIEAARKLKQLGLNNESIVETTGLHLNEVECLK